MIWTIPSFGEDYQRLSKSLSQSQCFFKKMGQLPPLFRLFSVFSNKHHYNFYNKYM